MQLRLLILILCAALTGCASLERDCLLLTDEEYNELSDDEQTFCEESEE